MTMRTKIALMLAGAFLLAGCESSTTDTSGSTTGVNLHITSSALSFLPGLPVKGTTATVTATVTNTGTVASTATTWTYSFGGSTTSATLPAIAAGGSTTLTFNVTNASATTLTATVTLDPTGAINETSETDNSAGVAITWSNSSERNIGITSTNVTPTTQSVGTDVTATVTFTYADSNISGGASVTSVLWRLIRVDDDSVVGSGTKTVYINGADATITVPFSESGAQNSKQYRLILDPDNTVSESAEDDNEYYFTVTWTNAV